MSKRKVKLQNAQEKLKIDIQGKNIKLLKKHLFEFNVASISRYDELIPDLLGAFDQDFMTQRDVLNFILDKIALVLDPTQFHLMEANYSYHLAKVMINSNMAESRDQIKHSQFQKSLQLLERANHIMDMQHIKQLRETEVLKNEFCVNLEKDVGHAVALLLSNSASTKDAYELAKSSVEYRSQNLAADHHSTIKALIEAAKIGFKIGNIDVQIEALNFAEEAYNMSMRTKNAESASEAKLIAANFFEKFGDVTKSAVMKYQAKLEEAVDIDSTSIISHGKFDRETYNVMKKLQPTLDKISGIANSSLWFHSMGIQELGVSGYVNDEYLAQKLGELFSPTNLKIAKMLCFEAINLGLVQYGIAHEVQPNLICSMLFAAKNPDLVEDIVSVHPEYFVNWNVIKATLPNASAASEKLIGQNVALGSKYNLFVEEAMSPVIEARLVREIAGVKMLSSGGEWSSKVEKALVTTFSPEYLTESGLIYTSRLGRNLGAITENVEIAQVLLFKAMIDALQSSGSKNYAPIDCITKAYPQIVGRVFVSHKSWITDEEILRLFDTPELLKPALVLPLAVEEVAVEGVSEVVDKSALVLPLVVEETVEVLGKEVDEGQGAS